FVALDLGLRKAPDLPEGAYGEEWQVHGGGFYHIRKYLVAPAQMPEHLTWFKWEAYATWLSGFALLVLVYYFSAELFLIDPTVRDLTPMQAIAISLGSIIGGWLIYDLICKSKLGQDQTRLMLALYGVLVVMAWAYTEVFSGRAALVHLGAFTATIMAANVAHIIIPNQRKVVKALLAGERPDPKYGAQAKQRSLHNNYLTLPVLFLMLSIHYPLAFATPYNWLIASLVFLMGVTIRHFFNTMHARNGMLWWTWGATAAIFLVIVWLSTFTGEAPEDVRVTVAEQALIDSPHFDAVRDMVLSRCSMCHAHEPLWHGLGVAPKGVMLESDRDIALHAHAIYLQAGRTHAMPPGNLTGVEPQERATLMAWYEGVR
ncbi:MAG: cysteine desulfurase, partial [Alphaproteobacteria bacterium HGW-Alphaproteobacteria-10]